MAFRKIPMETKVNAVKDCLKMVNVEEVAEEHGISASTLRRSCNKVIDKTPELLSNKPINAAKNAIRTVVTFISSKIRKGDTKETPICPECGSEQVTKNGSYTALNWLLVFLLNCFPGLSLSPERKIKKLICSNCNTSVASKERKMNTYIRESMKLLVAKLICVLRFKDGMSIRNISDIIKTAFGFHCSTGYIATLSQKVSEKAQEKMDHLANCTQKKSLMAIFDETFPKIKTGTAQLGVFINEYGLMLGIKAISDRKKDLLSFLSSKMPSSVRYFLSDYDKTYPKIVQEIDSSITLCKDFVHGIRVILRYARTAVNRTKVNTRGKLTKKRKKEITRLKKKLLRKRLYRVLRKIIKGFREEYSQVGAIYIEGGLEELKELTDTFPSLKEFYEKTYKFVHKYIEIWNMQMELHVEKGLPTTSNSIESKNSLFRVFSNISKCYGSAPLMEKFFSAVALMENYDIKTRGKNKGTNALMRAGVDLEELGGNNFFDAVNLEEIVLGKKRDNDLQPNTEDYLQLLDNVA